MNTLLDSLKEGGLALPPSSELDDAAVTDKVWQVIRALADRKLYLLSTDHLSDRELYETFLDDVLLEDDEPLPDWGTGRYIDVLQVDGPENLLVYLKYYAGDLEREDWTPDDLPDGHDELPPREPKPYDRDRHMPSGDLPRGG